MRTGVRLVTAILVALPLFGVGTSSFAGDGDPLPEGAAGIAAKHPGDQGIENDPAVLLAENFEGCSTVADLRPKWDVLTNQAHLGIVDDAGRGKSLMMTIPRQAVPLATGVSRLLAHTQSVLFLRWYQKFGTGWFVPDGSVHNGGSMSSRYYEQGRATPGVPADGHNKFLVSFENENSTGAAPGNLLEE